MLFLSQKVEIMQVSVDCNEIFIWEGGINSRTETNWKTSAMTKEFLRKTVTEKILCASQKRIRKTLSNIVPGKVCQRKLLNLPFILIQNLTFFSDELFNIAFVGSSLCRTWSGALLRVPFSHVLASVTSSLCISKSTEIFGPAGGIHQMGLLLGNAHHAL